MHPPEPVEDEIVIEVPFRKEQPVFKPQPHPGTGDHEPRVREVKTQPRRKTETREVKTRTSKTKERTRSAKDRGGSSTTTKRKSRSRG